MAEQETQLQAEQDVQVAGASDFSALLEKEFKPKTNEARVAVEQAVKTLAEQALENLSILRSETE